MPKTTYALPLIKPNGTRAMQVLAVSTVAVPFGSFHGSTTMIFWTIDGADVRVRFDGTAPTSLIGHIFEDGASGVWSVALAESAQFIRDGGTDAEITYSQMLGGA